MDTSQICILIAIVVYLVAMIYVGVACSKKGSDTTDDFYLGGRKLGPVVTAMSAEASSTPSRRLIRADSCMSVTESR